MPIDLKLESGRQRARRRAKLMAPSVLTRLPGSSAKFGPPRKLVRSAAEWTERWNTEHDGSDAARLVPVHEAEAIEWAPSVGV